MQRIIIFLCVWVIALNFLISAITKWVDISEFQTLLASFSIISWNVAEILAILIIGFEFCLGLILLFFPKKKIGLYLTIITLILFTCYLFYQKIVQPTNQNCYCYGEFLEVSYIFGMVRNLLFIALAIVVLKLNHFLLSIKSSKKYFIIMCAFLFFGIGAFITYNRSKEEDLKVFNEPLNQIFLKEVKQYTVKNFEANKQIICFYSLSCSHCKEAFRKVHLINQSFGGQLPITIFFFSNPEVKNISSFFDLDILNLYSYYQLPSELFFKQSELRLPAIYLVNKGLIFNKLSLKTLKANNIRYFINQ